MNRISIATLNIGGGIPDKNSEASNNSQFDVIDYIAKLIEQYKLDIICFQEILMSDEKSASMSQLISERTDLSYVNGK